MELIRLRAQCAICERFRYLQIIHYNSVFVDFTKVVGLLEIAPAHLVVLRQVVALAVSADTQIDILDLCIAMYEYDVLVVYVDVDNSNCKLQQECDKNSNGA